MGTDLDGLISGQRRVIAGLGKADDSYAEQASALAELLAIRYQYQRNGDDLAEAVEFDRAAVDATPDGDEHLAVRLANLGMRLRLQYAQTQELRYLDEAIEAGRAAVRVARPGHEDRSTMLSRLGVALRLRFRHTGQDGDLDECVDVSRDAVRAAMSADTGATARNTLSLALQARYERSGALPDLDEAVGVARDGAGIAAQDDPNRAIFLGTLAGACYLRFKAGGGSQDLREAIGAWREAISVMPEGDPGRQGYVHNLQQAERHLGDEAVTVAVGPPFPGPYGALAASVAAQEFDVWQAEEIARGRPPASASHLREMESLARSAAIGMEAGDWHARIVFLRLLVAALEGTDGDADPSGARASVNTDFTLTAATALTIGADPELFNRALETGLWALGWSRRQGNGEAEHAALGALALLHTLPYTSTFGSETYGVDHARWERNARARAVNPSAVITTHTPTADGTLIPAGPQLSMPEPLAAMQEAERYARAAIAVGGETHRDRDTATLAGILDWEGRLGGETDGAELAALRAQVPASAAGFPALSHLDKIAADFVRIAASRAPRPALDALLDRVSPQMAIAALWIALDDVQDLAPETVIQLLSVRAWLVDGHGDEQDRIDQVNLEIRLLPRIYAVGFTGGPQPGAEIPDAAGMVRRLQSGRKRTATARGAWLMYIADRCADIPYAAALGMEALAAAGHLAPSLAERHPQAHLFIEGKLHFGMAAQALHEDRTPAAAAALAAAAARFSFLGMLSRVGDCLALLDELSLGLEASFWPPVLAGVSLVLECAPDLDQNAARLVKLTLTQMLGTARGTGMYADSVLQLTQLASGFQTAAALSRVPPVAELDEAGQDMLRNVGLAGETADRETRPSAPDDFLDDETILVSWSDTLQRRPGDSPADRLRNRQRRFDRYLARLLATGDGVFTDALQLTDIQRMLDERTVLIIYFTGAWSRDEEGTASLFITRDEFGVDVCAESSEKAGDLFLRVEDTTAVTSRQGLYVADLRRKIQSDPMTDLVHPDAARMLADGSHVFLGGFRQRLAELRAAGKDRLWIVPHGPLHYYPLHLLGPEGDPLAASWTVTYLPNLGLLRPRAPAIFPLPARTATITSFGLAYQDARLTGLPVLARAAEEAQTVAALFGGQAVPEAQATKTAVLAALRESRYVHIAAHGGHNADAPAFQSIYLSGPGTEGIVFAHEVITQDLRGLELVTLSACETALGRFDRLDNLQGLPAALLLAGARTIIGTLWPVSDEAAAIFFPALYQGLARGQDVFDAFRDAQAAARAALPQYWDWGAFYLMGGPAR